jgi:exonuclease SbcD
MDPTAKVLDIIAEQGDKVKDAIVRLNISLPAEIEGQLRDSDIRDALKEAYYFAITRDIQRKARLRLGSRAAEDITPLDALKAYLESKKVSPQRTKILLEYGEQLIQGLGNE